MTTHSTEFLVQQGGILSTRVDRHEARIACQLVVAEYATKRLPLGITFDRNRDPFVISLTRVHAVRGVVPIEVPGAGRAVSVDRAIQQLGREKGNRGFGLGDIDVLSLPRATSVFDRGKQRRSTKLRIWKIRLCY